MEFRMNKVEPIRDKDKLKLMGDLIKVDGKYKEFALFKVGLHTGLRISDILKLKWADLQEDGHKIITYITETKTRKNKKVIFNGQLTEILQELRDQYPKDVFVFQSESKNLGDQIKHWSRQYAYDFINKYARKVGVKGRIGTHTLRKSFGYYHYKRGVSLSILQKIFQHSRPSITLDYLGITDDQIENVYLKTEL